MGEAGTTGSEYGLEMIISNDFLSKITEADSKLETLANTSKKTANTIVASFQRMGTEGVDKFIEKLKVATETLGKLGDKKVNVNIGNVTGSADGIVKVATAMGQMTRSSAEYNKMMQDAFTGKDVQQWQNLANQIRQNNERIKELTQSTKAYEMEMSNIQSGKGGMVRVGAKEEYQDNLNTIAALKQKNEELTREQQQIVKNNQLIKEEQSLQQQLTDLAKGKASMDEMRKRAEYNQLVEAYKTGTSELQKQAKAEDDAAKAAAKAVKEQEKANKEAERAAKLAERKAKEQKRQNRIRLDQQRSTYDGALGFSRSANTINQEIQAIKYLTTARDNLSKTDENYKRKLNELNQAILKHKDNIEEARKGASRLEDNHRRLMNTSDQLRRRLALLFSVSAITGYMKKLVQVRGELELQQVALQSILRDKEKANEVWVQIQQLALQSPFTLMQLTAYTKQLAAYQVESDKLAETTKRLADVSAGLGVDMGRIILAFGQVKAANYLRSAEVRQFTEAGINMLGELSKLYTELEGKMVSVGDVQERIQKRMVSFGDVEEVFNRLTSAGGMFYNMQEKQSETLRGMVAKLGDAFDIMLNKIGESNEGVLKGVVQTLVEMTYNWEQISKIAIPILNAIIARFLAIKGIQLFGGIVAGAKAVKEAISTLNGIIVAYQKGVMTAKTATQAFATALGGWQAIIAVAVTAIVALYFALRKTQEEADKLTNIFFEQQAAADRSVQNYENLVKVVRDGTKSYKEQHDAMEELKRTYADIVPAEYLEIKNIQDIKFNYKGATDAIREYYTELAKKKQIELVTGEEGKDATQAATNYVESVLYAIKNLDSAVASAVDKSDIRRIVAQLQKEIEDGSIKSFDSAKKRMVEMLHDLTGNLRVAQGAAAYLGQDWFSDDANTNLRELVETTTALKDRLKEIEDGNYMGNLPTQTSKALNATKDAFEKYSTSIKDSFSTIFSEDATKQQVDAAKKQVEALFKEMGKEMPDWTKAMTDEIYRMQDIKVTFDKALLEKEAKMVSSLLAKVPEDGRATIRKAFEDIQKQMDALDPSPVQKSVNMAIMSFIALNDVAFKGMANLSMQAGETAEQYFKRIKEGAKDTAQRIKELTGILSMGYLAPWQVEQTNKDLEAAQQQKKLEDYIATLEKNLVEEKKKTSGRKSKGEDPNQKELQALKERVKLLKEANKEYENNLKYFEKESAVAKTLSAYKNAFKQAGIADFLKQEFLDEDGLVKALEQLPNKVGGKYRDQALQFMADETAKIKVQLEIDDSKKALENLKKDIDKMFSDYDLFKSLTDIDFPPELASRIFGVDIVSLDKLKEKIEELKPEFKGEDAEKAYDDFLKKLADKEQKEQLERIKRYNAYLINAMAERSKVYLEEARQYQEVQDEMSYTDEERERIRRKIHEETAREIAKLDWKDLQESDFFINLYDDINNVSRGAIEEMIAKLRDMQDEMVRAGIPMKDIRAIMGRINDLEQELEDRQPFKGFAKNLKVALTSTKQLNKLEKERKKLQSEQNDTESDLKALEKEVGLTKQAYENAVNKYGIDSEQAKEAEKNYQYSIDAAEELRKVYDKQGNELENNRRKSEEIRRSQEKAAKTFAKIADFTSNMISVVGDISGVMSDMGIDVSEKFGKTLEGIEQTTQGINQFLNGKDKFDKITGIINAVVGLGKTVLSVFDIGQGDKRREREITSEINLVGKLQKYYEELKEKIESAYSLQTFDRANKLAEENIQQRNDALNKAIEAERRKKKTDESRIEQWQEEIAQNNKELENLQKERIQALGGMGGESTYKDAAQGFVDAWMSAFQETGDGLQALKDNFQDFLNEWFIKQATIRIAGQMLQPLFEMIDAAVGENSVSGSALVREEINAIKERAETLFPALNESLKSLFETMGMVGQGDQTLSGLQKGIEGVSESTAQIIEAYLNSIRFFVADTHDRLAAFLSSFTSSEIAVNPILSELRAQTELIRSINDTFGSIVARGGYREGGSAIRVIM